MRVATTFAAVFANNGYDLAGANRLLDQLVFEPPQYTPQAITGREQQRLPPIAMDKLSEGN